MTDTFSSLDSQIAELEDSLRLIAERKSQYPQAENIPLELIKNERRLQEQLAGLRVQRELLQEIPCPYRGLEYFDVPHAPNYFGRQAMVDKLPAKLRQSNFVALVGPSGCGKSSLVRAGLIPALERGQIPGSQTWEHYIFRPGDDPLRSLAVVLVARLAEARKLADHLRHQSLPIADVMAQLRAQLPSSAHLLLIADQFEETYTLCQDDACRRAFVDALLDLAATPWVTVLVTLRADFYGRSLEEEHFGRQVDKGLVTAPTPTARSTQPSTPKPTAIHTPTPMETAQPRPDLVVRFARHGATQTDFLSPRISGRIADRLDNLGTEDVRGPFEDSGCNGVFVPDIDNTLGTGAHQSGLRVGASTSLWIPVRGTVLFRDNLVWAFVDSTDATAELNESKNYNHSGNLCLRSEDDGQVPAPDLTVSRLRVDVCKLPQGLSLTARVGNGGTFLRPVGSQSPSMMETR